MRQKSKDISCFRIMMMMIVILFVIIFVGLLISKPNIVQAIAEIPHDIVICYRVESEIMMTTPAGQYYRNLFWKHNYELVQIMKAHPEKIPELRYVMFDVGVPPMEELVNGRGDEVQVEKEYVDEIVAAIDWFAEKGSAELRADVTREKERLQVEHFVGKTFNEVWVEINEIWAQDPSLVTTATAFPQGVITPTSVP